jgi:shikimate kinase
VNVLLIGPRGCGKSTLGRPGAGRLGLPFIELDDAVLATFPERSVREVWAARGEAAWREAESEVLAARLEDDNQVIALGGGVPMIDAARQRIESEQAAGRARVVYLRCTPDELARRLSAEPGDRPALTGDDEGVATEAAEVLARREPTYRKLADGEIDVTECTVDEAIERLTSLLISYRGASGGGPCDACD